MRGFVDLHCHFVANIDDGVRTAQDGVHLLEKLYAAGFSIVVGTPHMRPGMFDNDRPALERAYAEQQQANAAAAAAGNLSLPQTYLASEHFFDDIVFARLIQGEGLPYPGGGTALIEFPTQRFPAQINARVFDMMRRKITPVLAHPERYQPVWKDDSCLDPLLDAGVHLLLDLCSLVGKYGRAPQQAAEKLLEEEAYEAACSDAHRPSDVDQVVEAIGRLQRLVGHEEAERLLSNGPRGILGIQDHEQTQRTAERGT